MTLKQKIFTLAYCIVHQNDFFSNIKKLSHENL